MGLASRKETLNDLSNAYGLDGGVAEGAAGPASRPSDWDFLAAATSTRRSRRSTGRSVSSASTTWSGRREAATGMSGCAATTSGRRLGRRVPAHQDIRRRWEGAAIGIDFNHGYGWSIELTATSGHMPYAVPQYTVASSGWIDDSGGLTLDILPRGGRHQLGPDRHRQFTASHTNGRRKVIEGTLLLCGEPGGRGRRRGGIPGRSA